MRTPAVAMLLAGGALLAGLGLLVHAVNSGPDEPSGPGRSDEVAPTPPAQAPAAATVPTGRGARAPHVARGRTVMPAEAPVAPAGPAPAIGGEGSARHDPENLHYGGTQLRAQTAAIGPLVSECVAGEVARGRAATGVAFLTYIVAKKGDKFAIEDTAVDDERTTLQGAQLLECLRETARAMTFVGLPRHAEAIVVTHSVSVADGKLTEHKHVGFSYLR